MGSRGHWGRGFELDLFGLLATGGIAYVTGLAAVGAAAN